MLQDLPLFICRTSLSFYDHKQLFVRRGVGGGGGGVQGICNICGGFSYA